MSEGREVAGWEPFTSLGMRARKVNARISRKLNGFQPSTSFPSLVSSPKTSTFRISVYIYRDQGEEDKALCLKHVEMKGNYDTRSVSSCAACKYLKKKCTLNCIFAPYFPSDELGKFAKVHKVFGASNVSKILSEVPQDQRPDTVHTLVYEAEARLRDPVYGCIGAMALLHNKMLQLQQDLALVRSHLAHFTATNLPPPSTTIVYDDSIGTVPLVPYNICDGKRIENGSSCPVYCSEFDQYGSCSPPLGSFFQS